MFRCLCHILENVEQQKNKNGRLFQGRIIKETLGTEREASTKKCPDSNGKQLFNTGRDSTKNGSETKGVC